MEKKLRFLPKFNAFGIEKDELTSAVAPVLMLRDEGYLLLGLPIPADDAPKIAFVLGEEVGYYTIDFNYALAIAKTGAKLIFIARGLHCDEALNQCHGLVLPGGAFASPKRYYAAFEQDKHQDEPNVRHDAYVMCFHRALFLGLPILGVCAGAQVIACELGGSLFTDVNKLHGLIEHKSKQKEAHIVSIIKKGCLLEKIFKKRDFKVNSRHKEAVYDIPFGSPLYIYAVAPDGIPEAWGADEQEILCVQWHPEDYAADGDAGHQAIYDWLTERATAFQKRYGA